MATATFFTRGTFDFLRDLAANNNREWFKANRDRYERDLRKPALDFIMAFGSPLSGISKHYVADPRPVGGSLFRIHRDTRFSKDKSPYKTAVGIQFRHLRAKDVHAPGFYLHVAPGECFIGLGIWHPDSATLKKIREALVDAPPRWRRVVNGKRFRDHFELGGDALVRPPRGFDPEHPLIEDLKRKDFIASKRLPQTTVAGADFLDHFTGLCKAGSPFVRYLCGAVGLQY